MANLFSEGRITVTESSITFPSGFFYTESLTIARSKIISTTYKYDNFIMFYLWRFIVGFLQLFTIIGIPEAIKVLRGDVLVNIVVKEGYSEKVYGFWLKHRHRAEFRQAIM